MRLIDGISHLFGDLAVAKRMAHLYSLSDAELAGRGLTREALKEQFIANTGRR